MNTRYNKMDEKSKTIVDALGMKIDEGVRELIVLLNYNGMTTTQSCWGHKNWGNPYPWVDIDIKYEKKTLKLISEFEISTEYLGIDTIRILPNSKTLIKGRREFNKLKEKLKNYE